MSKARPVKRAPGGEAKDPAADAAVQAAFELLEALPVPVFFKARDGRYLGVNKAWEDFFGIARGEFAGKRVADLYPQVPEVAEKHAQMDELLWRNPGGQSYEIPILTRHGVSRDTIYYKATFGEAGVSDREHASDDAEPDAEPDDVEDPTEGVPSASEV